MRWAALTVCSSIQPIWWDTAHMQTFSNSNMKYKTVSLLTVFHFHNKHYIYFLSQVKHYDATNCITFFSAMADDGGGFRQNEFLHLKTGDSEKAQTVLNLSIDELRCVKTLKKLQDTDVCLAHFNSFETKCF